MSSTTAAGRCTRDRGQAVGAVAGRSRPATPPPSRYARQQVERRPVVLDDHDHAVPADRRRATAVVRPLSGRRCGTAKPKVLPTPTSLSSHIAPPSSSTIRRHRVSPSPVPSLAWRAAAALLEGLEDALLVLGGDADAGVADRDDERRSLAPCADRARVPPSGVNFTALDSRLSSDLLEPQLVGVDLSTSAVDVELAG